MSPNAVEAARGTAGPGDALRRAAAAFGASETEMFYSGPQRYVRTDAGWQSARSYRGVASRHPEDPLWLLDFLAGPLALTSETVDEIDGEPAHRLLGTLDLVETERWLGGAISLPCKVRPAWLHRAEDRWHRAVPFEAWVDLAGQLRRIAYQGAPLRIAEADWIITDLWDYGCSADLPSVPASA